ncbi:MAG TPA: hypothetical protein VN963_03655 [bacterium]|nr:hypothetical protein [bacterium]
MKNALTFWNGGQLQRSGLSVVPPANKSLSPIGAAYSEPFSDDAAPEQSLGYLWGDDSTNMLALTGLAPCRSFKRFSFKASQGHSRLFKGIKAYSSIF